MALVSRIKEHFKAFYTHIKDMRVIRKKVGLLKAKSELVLGVYA